MMLLTLFACLADLRPAELTDNATSEAEGRALLAAAADAHGGLDTWKRKQTTELLLTDQWNGTIANLFNPWPDARMRAHIVQRTGSFDSRVRFLEGSQEGITWGIEEGSAYTIDPDGNQLDVQNGDISFMLPTTHYFVDLPFRLQEAELVRSVGTQTVAGEAYDVVYATWGSLEKNPDYDQYLVFLNRDTHRVEKLQYTVREVAGFVTGTCHLDDQRLVDGLWVPHLMTVTESPADPTDEGGMHVMRIEAMRYDSVERDTWRARSDVEPLDAP